MRRILNLHWSFQLPDTELLERTGPASMERMLNQHRLRWVGNLIRMPSYRIPKQVFYGELSVGKRPRHKPKLRFKDCVKSSLSACNFDLGNWESFATNEPEWRKQILVGVKSAEMIRTTHQKLKRAVRTREFIAITYSHFVCELCSRVCLSKAG